MRIMLVRAECGNTRSCPNVNISDRGTYVVQGYAVAVEHASAAEAVVELPLALLPELSGAAPRDGLVLTDHGTIWVRGTQVTDPDVLAELNLPTGENAVEVPLSALPELEVSHAR